MAYKIGIREIFVGCSKLEARGGRSIEFFLDDPRGILIRDWQTFIKTIRVARRICRTYPDDPFSYWYLAEDCCILSYNYENHPALDAELYKTFDPQINPNKIKQIFEKSADETAKIEISRYPPKKSGVARHPDVQPLKVPVTEWLKEYGLTALWHTDPPVNMPDNVERCVYIEEGYENYTLYFFDKNLAMLCKLSMPSA